MGLGLAEPDFRSICYVEIEEYPRECLIAGQRAGYMHPAPIWDDLKTFDAKPWAGHVDTLLAGYPCQPFSMAGQRKGADDPRHLWPDIERVIGELGDGLRWCFFENVAGHLTLGLDTVLRSLRGMGFTAAAGIFSAEETGATHERQRVFIVAYRESVGAGEPHDAARTESRRDTRQGACGRSLRDDAASRLGEPSESMVHAPRFGCGEGRAKPEFRRGRDTASSAGGELADAERGGWPQDLSPFASGPKPTSPQLHPPGPSDVAGWQSVLRVAPHLSPALSVSDIKRAAEHFAQMVAQGRMAEAEAESVLRGMADAMARRTRALRLLGNGVCPLAAAYAWRSLSAAHGLGAVDMGTGRDRGTRADGVAVT